MSSPGRAPIALEMLEDARGSRRAGDSDRRRRADRRQRDRGARRSSRRSRSSAWSAALYPVDVERAQAARTAPIGGPTLAEGIAVKNVGKLTLPIVRALVSRHRAGRRGASRARGERVSSPCRRPWRKARARPGLPRCWRSRSASRGRKVGLVLCGGNIDPRILASIMVRELERENRIVSFRLTIPDRPGVLGMIATRLRRARRQHPRSRSPAAVPRRAGQGRAARRHGRRRATRAHGDDDLRRARRRRLQACAHRSGQYRIKQPARYRAAFSFSATRGAK